MPEKVAMRWVAAKLRATPLVAFFSLAYAVSWVMWTPMLIAGVPVFSSTSHTPSPLTLPGIAVGVTGSAFLMTWVTQGRAGVRRMLERLTSWRAGIRWYVVAVALVPIGQIAVSAVVVSPSAVRALSPSAVAFYPGAYLAHFVFGPLFEESGWRGFALPRLQHRYGPITGTLLLGLLWSGWHFFLYVPSWLQGGAVNAVIGLILFVVSTTSLSFIFTWLSNNTRASLLLAILLHGSVDGTATYVQVLADKGIITPDGAGFSSQFGVLVTVVIAAVAIVAATRMRVGYPRYREEAERLDVTDPTTKPAAT